MVEVESAAEALACHTRLQASGVSINLDKLMVPLSIRGVTKSGSFVEGLYVEGAFLGHPACEQ